MKIAIISDMHLGYARFEEDSFLQAESAFLDANEKADVVICAGDVFDSKIPKLEALRRAAELLRRMKIPVFAIHGNHERRSREMTNPVQLLGAMDALRYLHSCGEPFEKGGERVFIFGFGSVPEESASAEMLKALESAHVPGAEEAFRVLVMHQTVSDFVPGESGVSTKELEALPFDLIVNGHLHARKTGLDGKLLMPGSTVITQLKKEETEPRGYVLFDSKTKKSEFVRIRQRAFFFEEIALRDAGIADVKNAVEGAVARLRGKDAQAIIKIRISGNLKAGIGASDFGVLSINDPLVFIDNGLGAVGIKDRIERIKQSKDEKLSVRDVALKELEKALDGKITLFDPHELFEKLCDGADEAEAYCESLRKIRGNSA